MLNSGYDAPRISHLLAGPPVEMAGLLRSDRVTRRPTPPQVYDPKGDRQPSTVATCRTSSTVTYRHR